MCPCQSGIDYAFQNRLRMEYMYASNSIKVPRPVMPFFEVTEQCPVAEVALLYI